MNCPRCHAQLVDNARFCGICGNTLTPSISEARPPAQAAENNEATLLVVPRADGQPAGGTPEPTLPVRPARFSPPLAGQPGVFQASPPAGWTPAAAQQPPNGAVPVVMNRGGAVLPPPVRKRRRAGRIWLNFLLVLVLLVAVLAGAWFLGVRPYVHTMAQARLDQALGEVESQILLAQLALPAGVPQTIHVSESAINAYLSSHSSSQLQNLHASVTSQNVTLSFTVYGQNCAIALVPIASNGQLQVTQVQVQGVLWLIMSNDELASYLNTNLQNFSSQMHRTVQQVTLQNQEITVKIT